VHAMHPGAVDTNFIAHADEGTQKYMRGLDLLSAEDAADTLIWLVTAAEPGTSTGGYFHQRRRIPTSAAANVMQPREGFGSKVRSWRRLSSADTRVGRSPPVRTIGSSCEAIRRATACTFTRYS
jgi:hypothetical protein